MAEEKKEKVRTGSTLSEPPGISLLGKRVEVWCATYIYEGFLSDIVGDAAGYTHFFLTDCGIVFETGDFNQKKYKDRQKVKKGRYIAIQAHESICESGQEP